MKNICKEEKAHSEEQDRIPISSNEESKRFEDLIKAEFEE